MIYLNIAGLNIAAEGFDTPLFQERTKEYQYKTTKADLTIHCKFNDHIPFPRGTEVASSGERHWLKDENTYSFYDSVVIDGQEIVIASVTANKDWSYVESELMNVEQWGGPESDVRNFNLLGEVFRWFILFHQGIILHSSCLKCEGKGIAFSAPSGTGKSTHTGLWRKYYSVEMINDDSPAVRFIDNKMIVFGTPWSGKTDINHNINAPLAYIVFLEQANENQLEKLTNSQVSQKLLRELIRPVYPELLLKTLDFMEKMITNVPAYLLKCTISEEAATLTHSLL